MDRARTWIKGLDEILGGGLPRGRCVLVVGSPGSGKTTFAMQFLAGGVKGEERGLYISLDEKPEFVKENLAGFGWDLDGLERSGQIIFLDATSLRKPQQARPPRYETPEAQYLRPPLPELTLKGLVRTIERIVTEEAIQRIAIDPITTLMLRYYDLSQRRRAMLVFFDSLIATGCTTIVTSELRTGLLDRTFQLEEFLSQGAILLHTLVHNGSVLRALQVEKMRGIAHDTQLRPYQIADTGIEVFPKDRVF